MEPTQRMRRSQRRGIKGSVLVDAMLAFTLLSTGAAAFFSLMPQIDRLERIARQRAIALNLANRMIDQLQQMKPANITPANLTALGLVNPGQTQSPLSFTNIPLDNSTNYSPAQALSGGTGQLTITSVDNGSVMCAVEIDWISDKKKTEKLVTGTVIGGYR